MTKTDFKKILSERILLLDGATGTELHKMGLPGGVSPEKWSCSNPEILYKLQSDYIKSGSDIILTASMGANRIKLAEFGHEKELYQINKQLAEISRKAAGGRFVAGDLSSTGKFVEPFGELPFDEAVEVYKEQIKGLLDGGIDLLFIETMMDIQETRAALIAARETTSLPIICSMTFSEDGKTLTGTDALTALITLQSLGADAFGCNCSTGPKEMLSLIKKIKPYSKIPLIAKPNAGLPRLVDGVTMFDMSSKEFAGFVPAFIESGVNLIGGCCGTTPEFIKVISNMIKTSSGSALRPIPPVVNSLSALSSARKSVLLAKGRPLSVIGERINPTGKKNLQNELKSGSLDEVRRFAMEQAAHNAEILDVNLGMPGIDEKEMMKKTVKMLSASIQLPLCIDSSDPEVIEKALRLYPGRALINSISMEKNKIQKLLPVAAFYGAMFIVLPLNDNEIPKTAKGRIKIVEELFSIAEKSGYSKEDIVIDGLVMTVSSDQAAARETLELINWASNVFGVNTVVGLSNVSFGLPERKWVNSAFLAMAAYNGLSMAIANPGDEIITNVRLASDVLSGNDAGSFNYINHFSSLPVEKEKIKIDESGISPETKAYECIIHGDKNNIIVHIKKALDNNIAPETIVNDHLLKAINKVGELYQAKKYFLPQLIASAEAMKAAFTYLEPLLSKSSGSKQKTKIVLATVKGDIHDIGKNIVALMLRNYGYDIIDLGKDVPSELIVETALREKASIIGLSALMTTTMTEMKNVIKLANEKGLNVKFIIGGAVITQSFADEIKAHGYAKNGVEAVDIVKKLLGC